MKKVCALWIILLFVMAFSFCAIQPVEAQTENDPDNFMWGIEYNPFRQYATPESDLNIISNSSVQWIRVVFRWTIIEPEKNTYDFTFYDNFVQTATSRNLKILGVVGSGYDFEIPEWVKEEAATGHGIDNPNYVAYWKEYVRKTVERYDTIKFWQVENELNNIGAEQRIGDFGSYRRNGDWTTEKIRELVTEGATIVKSIGGSKVIINVAVDNPSYFIFARNMTEDWKVDYDILGIDYYSVLTTGSDPTLGNTIGLYINNSKQFKEDIIVCEAGYSTWTANHTLENQADFIEITATKAYKGEVLGYFVYKFHDTAKRGEKDIPEPYYGLLTSKKEFKPAWHRYQQVITGNITATNKSMSSTETSAVAISAFGGPVVFLMTGIMVILIGILNWKRRY
jgi:hypothetical protein